MARPPRNPNALTKIARVGGQAISLQRRDDAGALSITDGTNTFPTVLLTIPPSGGRLTDLGSDNTLLRVGDYQSYTPVLISSGTAPSGTYVLSGHFFQASEFVASWGKLEIGSGFSPGTGSWTITLPTAVPLSEWSGTSNRYVGTGFVGNVSNMLPLWIVGDTPAGDQILFIYPGTWPAGTAKELATGGDWTFANGDVLNWMVVYPTANVL